MTYDLLILGNVNVDLILGPLAQWPQRGTETLVPHLHWRVGGNAGNAALACAGLGSRALTISPLGDDLPGRWLHHQLPPEAVRWLSSTAQTSVTVAVTHPDGERTFITQLGHLEPLAWADLESHVPASRFTLLAGAFLTPALRREYPCILRACQGRGSQVALDMGWPDGGFTDDVRREVLGWLPCVHHLLLNDLEAQALTGTSTPLAALSELRRAMHPQAVAVIKQGAQGVLASVHGEPRHVPAPQVNVLDTVGAGDTWNAAYLHALAGGASLETALEFAVQTASLAISTRPRRFKLA